MEAAEAEDIVEREDEVLEDLPGMSAAEIDRFLRGTSPDGGVMDTIIGKVGYVALLGRPNTGKSTLLNALLGYQLSAVSSKPQTTRKRWLGILTDDESQLLFLDTPGVHASGHALGQAMDGSVQQAVRDADVVVVMVDPTRPMQEEDEMVARYAKGSQKPLLLAINKQDIASALQTQEAEDFYRGRLGDQIRSVFRIAAVNPLSLPSLVTMMQDLMPLGPFLYPPDQLSDARERDIAAEIIRQTLLERLQQEVPHCVAVVVEEFNERRDAVFVRAVLHLERDSQKGIVIGKGGAKLGEIRTATEEALSAQFGKTAKVSFTVTVTKEWRRDPKLVAAFLGGP